MKFFYLFGNERASDVKVAGSSNRKFEGERIATRCPEFLQTFGELIWIGQNLINVELGS